jgi:hypothetical protein
MFSAQRIVPVTPHLAKFISSVSRKKHPVTPSPRLPPQNGAGSIQPPQPQRRFVPIRKNATPGPSRSKNDGSLFKLPFSTSKPSFPAPQITQTPHPPTHTGTPSMGSRMMSSISHRLSLASADNRSSSPMVKLEQSSPVVPQTYTHEDDVPKEFGDIVEVIEIPDVVEDIMEGTEDVEEGTDQNFEGDVDDEESTTVLAIRDFSLITIGHPPAHQQLSPAQGLESDSPLFHGFVPSTCPEDTVHLDPDLEQFSLCVNQRFRVLICLTCHHVVLPQNILGHLMRTHHFKHNQVPDNLGERLRVKFNLADEVPKISQRIKPVFGLETRRRMYCCPKCFHGYSEPRYFAEHLRTQHEGSKYSPFECPAQRFTPRGNSSYFPVIIEPTAPPDPKSDLELLIAQQISHDLSAQPMQFTEDTHLLNRFLTRSKWTKVVEGLAPKWVRAYVGVPTDDEEDLKSLSKYTQEWLSESEELISREPQPLLNAMCAYKTFVPVYSC